MSNNTSANVQILGVVGSPRPNGNTDRLIDKVLDGAACSGAATSKLYLGKLNIAPCRACEACKKIGRCVVEDDMQQVVGELENSSIWVLGTPVYFWGPSGWMKAFIDRFYGAREHIDFSTKKAIIVVPFEDTKIAMAKHTVGMIREALTYLKVPILAEIVVPGVMNKSDVGKLPDVLEAACRAGREAVAQPDCPSAASCGRTT